MSRCRPELALLALALAGCASAPADPASPRALAAALAGTWDNQRQFDAAPATLKVPPSVNGEWLDLQHALFTRVEAPAFGEQVLYLEWRSGGPEGPVSRQRIWSFSTGEDGRTRMAFYAFVDGKPWAGRGAEPNAFRTLRLQDLRGYDATCALVFERTPAGVQGLVTADRCRITAASGRAMGIFARVRLDPDGSLEYEESGRLDDGRFAFRVPPTQAYRFERR